MYSLTTLGQVSLHGNIESLSKIALTMQFRMTHSSQATRVIPIVSEEQSKALDLVESFLSHRGYTVRKLTVVRGFSSQEYSLDLFASRSELKFSNIILRIAGKDGPSVDDILKLHVVSFELDASKAIFLVPSTTIPEEVRKQAEFCHISIYSGPDAESAASSLISSYDSA